MSKRVTFNKQLQAGTVVIGTATAVVLSSVDLTELSAFSLSVENAGSQALNAFSLQRGPDGSLWPKTVDNSTLATLAAGAAGEIAVAANPGGYYRAFASVASGTTTLNIWVVGA